MFTVGVRQLLGGVHVESSFIFISDYFLSVSLSEPWFERNMGEVGWGTKGEYPLRNLVLTNRMCCPKGIVIVATKHGICFLNT